MKIKKWEDLDKETNDKYMLRVSLGYAENTLIHIFTRDGMRFMPCSIYASATTEQRIATLKAFGFDIEFEEPPKLSKRAWHLVNYLHEDWWLARDMLLYAFESKPKKTNSGYYCGQANDDYIRIPNDLFPFITHDRAWSVKELRELEVQNDD